MSPQENKRSPVLMVHQEQRDKDILFSPAAVTITQMCLCCDVVFLLSFHYQKTKQTLMNKEEADIAVTTWIVLNGKPV